MQRIRALTPYQKIVLLILLMMALLFTILYPVTISREGFLYKDAILLLALLVFVIGLTSIA